MKLIAKYTSRILSPLLIPTYGAFMSLWLTGLCVLPVSVRWRVTSMVFAITCLLPMVAILSLWAMHKVSDLGLNNRSERPIPYTITVVCYLLTAFYLYTIHAPQWMWLFIVGGAGAAVVSFVVNFWWKISAHMAAIGGLVALSFRFVADNLAVIDMWPVVTIVILLAGLLGTSRIYLGCHTLAQVLAGAANGFLWVWLLTL